MSDRDLAERVREVGGLVAVRVTDRFLEEHPDFVERFGERARLRGEQDARFHVDHLSGALLAGSAAAFEEYARWTARVLAARGIAPVFLDENLGQVGAALEELLGHADAERIRPFIASGRAACTTPAPTEAEDPGSGLLSSSLSVFVSAALLGDRHAALTVVTEALASGAAVFDVYRGVLQEALYEVGRRWESARINVAQEHIATAVTQFVLAHLYERLPRPAASRGAAIVTGVSGERHGLGGQMVADALEMHGWRVRYLGTDAPSRGVVEVMQETGATLLAISATMIFNLTAVAELIAEVRAAFPGEPPRILVGGRAFRGSPGAWRQVGADAQGGDLDSAVVLADRFAAAER